MDVMARTYPFQRRRPFEMPEEYAWLRANSPVARVKLASGDVAWLVTRHEDVRSALADARFGRDINSGAGSRVDTGYSVDAASPVFSFGGSISVPPGHGRWRRIVNRAFTQRQADTLRESIGEHIETLLDELTGQAGPVDLMADFAYRFPIRVICDLLGIEQRARPEFTALAARLTRRDFQSSFADFGDALQGIGRYAIGLIVRKRRELGDDLLSELIGLHDEDGSRLSNEELVSTIVLLLMAGYESAAVQFGNAILALCHHPDQLARLVADPALVGTAVDEFLRYAQIGTGFAVAKSTTEDIEIGGAVIPAGAIVFLSLGSANRDQDVFGADAEEFDLGRASATRHLAFGAGPHFCLGAALARAELAEGVSRLLARCPGLRLVGALDDVPLASNLFTYYPGQLRVTW
jgi:cytochrome P450